MQHKRARSTAIAITVALVAAIPVAACGSSATTGTTSGSSAAATASTTRTKLTACLKKHGVALPTRPAGGKRPAGGSPPGGGGFSGGGGAGGAGGPGAQGAQSSKFRAAFKACGANFGGGRFRRGGAGAKPTAAALAKFTACVAKHGYKLPKANTSGDGSIFPKSIESNKKFEAAAKACQSDLRPSGAPRSGASGRSAAD